MTQGWDFGRLVSKITDRSARKSVELVFWGLRSRIKRKISFSGSLGEILKCGASVFPAFSNIKEK